MAIVAWYTFAIECRLERAGAGAWRGGACSRPLDDVGAKYECEAPSILLSGDAITVKRTVVIPNLDFFDRLRARAFGPRRVEDILTIAIVEPRELREGDMLRVCRDGMGRHHASLQRRVTDGGVVVVWALDDPKTGFG